MIFLNPLSSGIQMSKGSCSITAFKSKFTSVRPNRFRVDFPQVWESKMFKNTWVPKDKTTDMYIYCKSASLPASKISSIQIPYLGRMYYDSGDREYNTLSLEFYNSQDFAIRNFIEEWMNNINFNNQNYQLDTGSTTVSSAFDIFMDHLKITQLDRRENPIKSYEFFGVFPVECSEIKLDFDNSDSIETFTVDFQYQWWETEEIRASIPGTGANSSGQGGPADSEVWQGGGGGNGYTIISPSWTPGGITRGGSTRG